MMKTPTLATEQYGFSKLNENSRACGQPKWQNASTYNVYLAKTINNKMTMVFNKRNIQICYLNVNRESIIYLLNKMLYLSDSRHFKK